MEQSARKVLVSGHAIVPQGTVSYETNKLISMVLEIEYCTSRILNAETTFITSLANKFFKDIAIGKCLPDEYDLIRQQVKRDMCVDSKKALLKALSVVNERFQLLKMHEYAQLKKKCPM